MLFKWCFPSWIFSLAELFQLLAPIKSISTIQWCRAGFSSFEDNVWYISSSDEFILNYLPCHVPTDLETFCLWCLLFFFKGNGVEFHLSLKTLALFSAILWRGVDIYKELVRVRMWKRVMVLQTGWATLCLPQEWTWTVVGELMCFWFPLWYSCTNLWVSMQRFNTT